MRSKSILVLAMVVLFFASSPSSFATIASFQGLGDLPGELFSSSAYDVSADGSVVVGKSRSAQPIGNNEAFRWTLSTGMVGIGDLPGGNFKSEADGVSANGLVVVGEGYSTGGTEAFRWENGVMTGLGTLSGGTSGARRVSADGSVVVGWSQSALGTQAFRWENDVMVGLGDLSGGDFYSSALDVSVDGSVIVGCSKSALGDEAFRWENNVMAGLGDLFGGAFSSYANAVSADGTVVVGRSSSALGDYEAFRWENGVMQGLSDSPGGIFGSEAFDVSADGSVVLGMSHTGSTWEAFIWDADNGMRNLKQVLVRDFGLDLTGWTLHGAHISNDGLTYIGNGTNPNRDAEAWVATVPEPFTLLLLALGGVFLRKRHIIKTSKFE